MVDALCSGLMEPWASLVRAQLADPLKEMFARVTETSQSHLCAELAHLVPGQGVQLVEPRVSVKIMTSVPHHFRPLEWVGFSGVRTKENEFVVGKQDSIWKISDGISDRSWTCVHLFAGAFQGWMQAVDWLKTKDHFPVAKQIAVDNDPEVANIWKHQGHVVCELPILSDAEFAAEKLGCLGGIEQRSWLNLLRDDNNLWLSMSPPCQPWSSGGLMTGLNSENGLRFAQAIEVIAVLRPLVVTAECSDKLPSHNHHKILRALLHRAGYELAWTAISDHSEVVRMSRRRWLAVYIRKDVEINRLGGNFKLYCEKKGWNHQCFQFLTPQEVEDQLILTPSQLDLYGDPQLLPKGLSKGIPKEPTREQVLDARVLQNHDVMPTLVASYSQQHHIPLHHLQSKGIFAVLSKREGYWAFIEPFKFVGLLGSPVTSMVVVHSDIATAFHHLGNSISVTHALLATLIGLTAITATDLSVKQVVLECFEERIKSDNCQILRQGDVFIMCPDQLVSAWVESIKPIICDDPKLVAVIGETQHQLCEDETIQGLLTKVGWTELQIVLLQCHEQDDNLPVTCQLRQFCGKRIRVTCGGQCMFECRILAVEPNSPDLIQDVSTQEIDSSSDSPMDEEELCPASQLDCIEARAALRPESIVAIIHFPESQPTFMMCHEDNFLEEVGLEMKRVYGNTEVHALSHVPTWSRTSFVVLAIHRAIGGNMACIVCVNETSEELAVLEVERAACIGDLFPNVITASVNALVVDPKQQTVLSNGDLIMCTQAQDFMMPARSVLAIQKGCLMGDDEMSWAARVLNEVMDESFILQPLNVALPDVKEVLKHALEEPLKLISQTPKGIQRVLLPILVKGHWTAVEITLGVTIQCSIVAGTHVHIESCIRESMLKIGQQLGCRIAFYQVTITSVSGLCGWTLLLRWYNKKSQSFPWETKATDSSREVASRSLQEIAKTMMEGSRILQLARCVRAAFLANHEGEVDHVQFGGANEEMDASPKADPWQAKDPWVQGIQSNQPKKVQHSKWEDLGLPKNHPFVGEDGQRLSLITRQQLGNQHGIAFATKANLTEIINKEHKASSGVLMPVVDRGYFQRFHPTPNVSGPWEITVADVGAECEYKRQVLLVTLAGKVSCQYETPAYRADLVELKEIVFEIDTRLLAKDQSVHVLSHPMESIKAKISEQFPVAPLKNVTMYAFKKIQRADESVLIQIIGKIAAASRPGILEFSGCGDVLARDFVQRGEDIQDHTILPKFWEASKAGREEALRSSSKTKGFCGVVCTRRGVAIRAWVKDIASMRKAILMDDKRICEANLATVPRIKIESCGWPSNATPEDIVKAVQHACRQAPVPTRAYRSLGVNFWTLMFGQDPGIRKFSVCFNGSTVEILLMNDENVKQMPKKAKDQSKSRATNSKPSAKHETQQASKVDQTEQMDRLTMLESRFNVMERKQEAMEGRMDQQFSSVNDQLRQILQAVQPRSPSHSATGLTPPPKAPKVGP